MRLQVPGEAQKYKGRTQDAPGRAGAYEKGTGRKQMLCEECHVNEANFTVSVVAGEETTVRHLCADCMSRMNADLMKGGMNKLINTVLSAMAERTTAITALLVLVSGMIIAMNIPYIASPRQLISLSGMICPEKAPSDVPRTQPNTDVTISP